MIHAKTVLTISIALAVLLTASAAGAQDPNLGPRRGPAIAPARPVEIAPKGPADPDAALAAALNQADLVFTGTVSKVVRGPTAMSYPPIYTMQIEFTGAKVIKGNPPKKAAFSYRSRQKDPPSLAKGDRLIVAAAAIPGRAGQYKITKLAKATAENLRLAKVAAKLPVGWSMAKGKPLSPHASLGAKAWPKAAKPTTKIACSKTGRPALLCGPGVTLTAKWTPPVKPVKWANPYGDGLFKITVTNTTKKAVEVPALLADGKGRTLWADSLVIVWRGKSLLLPEAGGIGADVRSVRLEAGASVTTEINALKLKGVGWPRGGSRVYLRFALGEKSGESFFYYLSRHHDKLREQAQSGAGG